MADNDPQPPVVTPPAQPQPQPQPPAEPQKDTPPALSADEVNRLKQIESDYFKYKSEVDPILETLASDDELLKTATERHNKRLGRIPADAKKDGKENEETPEAKQLKDTRSALVDRISGEFESKYGLDKLPDDKLKEARGRLGVMLKRMLDPNDNKTMTQIFEEVSLKKLPEYLENAYYLANRNNEMKDAYEKGKSEVLSQYEGETGSIGSMASSSLSSGDDVSLSPIEKRVAQNLGVTPEAYLKNKKKLLGIE